MPGEITQLQVDLERVNARIAELEAFLPLAKAELEQINTRIAQIQRQIELGGCPIA